MTAWLQLWFSIFAPTVCCLTMIALRMETRNDALVLGAGAIFAFILTRFLSSITKTSGEHAEQEHLSVASGSGNYAFATFVLTLFATGPLYLLLVAYVA